ncbi:MAG: YncE family protein, partial [Gemmatimonadetes bacterium]|nr:YncE family protein [Gemmatimonadota bacterium]
MQATRSFLLAGVVLATPMLFPRQAPPPPEANYWIYVANESSDIVSRVRFGPDGIEEEKTISVGWHPADLDGAHGLFVAPTGDHWYLSLAHGRPFGTIWKFETGTDRFVDSTTV